MTNDIVNDKLEVNNELIKAYSDGKKAFREEMDYLLQERLECVNRLDDILEQTIPIKQHMEYISARIERLLGSYDEGKYATDKYSVSSKIDFSPNIVDEGKALKFLEAYPECFKKELNITALKKLIKEGVVPDPEVDGIDISKTFTKFSYRKK